MEKERNKSILTKSIILKWFEDFGKSLKICIREKNKKMVNV